MEIERAIVLCHRENTLKCPGKYVSCVDCGTKVYLSDTSLKATQEKGSSPEPICFHCSKRYLKKEHVLMKMTKEQRDEIEPKVGKEKLDRMIKALFPND